MSAGRFIVERFENRAFKSNTYLISSPESEESWLIDLGCVDDVLDGYHSGKVIKGVFLTHDHYDHIFDIHRIVSAFPDCTLFASEDTLRGIKDPKKNLSFYHDCPISFEGQHVQIVHDQDVVELNSDLKLKVLSTPGHSQGSMTYVVDDHFFTGDSYVPYHHVVTKLPGGNKEESIRSLKKIRDLLTDQSLICAGHGEIFSTQTVKAHLDSLIRGSGLNSLSKNA